jgi:hypothetical protein
VSVSVIGVPATKINPVIQLLTARLPGFSRVASVPFVSDGNAAFPNSYGPRSFLAYLILSIFFVERGWNMAAKIGAPSVPDKAMAAARDAVG